MKKTRSDAKLLNLPEEQQAQLAEWLLNGMPYHAAQAAVEKQFGLQVSIASFTGFWNEVCQPALLARRARAVKTSDTIAAEVDKNPGSFDKATLDAIKQKVLELSIDPRADSKDVASLFSLLLHARNLDQNDEKLSIANRRVNLLEAAAREAKEKLTKALTQAKGGLTPEGLAQIQEAAALL